MRIVAFVCTISLTPRTLWNVKTSRIARKKTKKRLYTDNQTIADNEAVSMKQPRPLKLAQKKVLQQDANEHIRLIPLDLVPFHIILIQSGPANSKLTFLRPRLEQKCREPPHNGKANKN